MHRRLPTILLVALACLAGCDKASRHLPARGIEPPSPRAGAAQAPGLARYDAELVYADFTSHDTQALEKYQRGPFLLTGRLQKVRAIGTGEIRLDLKAAGPDHPVRVRLKADRTCPGGGTNCPPSASADTLPRGFKVYLECDKAGLDGGEPTVYGCVFTQAGNTD